MNVTETRLLLIAVSISNLSSCSLAFNLRAFILSVLKSGFGEGEIVVGVVVGVATLLLSDVVTSLVELGGGDTGVRGGKFAAP